MIWGIGAVSGENEPDIVLYKVVVMIARQGCEVRAAAPRRGCDAMSELGQQGPAAVK
jgi:hypothetical protein